MTSLLPNSSPYQNPRRQKTEEFKVTILPRILPRSSYRCQRVAVYGSVDGRRKEERAVKQDKCRIVARRCDKLLGSGTISWITVRILPFTFFLCTR